MRYLFLLLQLFFIFSVTEFAGAISAVSSGENYRFNDSDIDNLFNKYRESGLFGDNQNSGNSYRMSSAPYNDLFDDDRTLTNDDDDLYRKEYLYNSGKINTNYDKDLQSLETFLKNGEKLDSKYFSDNFEDLDGNNMMSASDDDNLASIKELYRDYQNLVNDPELQNETMKNSPDFHLQTLKKLREDYQITGYNLYKFLKKNSPILSKYKKKIDKYFGINNYLLNILNLIIRHKKYSGLYLASKESMLSEDIWSTLENGKASNKNSDSGKKSEDQKTENAENTGNANNDSSTGEENEETTAAEAEGSEATVNQQQGATESIGAESIQLESDRVNENRIDDSDDSSWGSVGGILGGAAVVGGAGVLMLNSDSVQPQYDDDYYRQSAKSQTKNQVEADSLENDSSDNDSKINSDDFIEDAEQNQLVDSQSGLQKVEEPAMQNEIYPGDDEDNSAINATADTVTKDNPAIDSDTDSYEDDEIFDESTKDQSMMKNRSARIPQTSRINSQMNQAQFSTDQSIRQNINSTSQQNFEQGDEFEAGDENAGVFEEVQALSDQMSDVSTQPNERLIYDRPGSKNVPNNSIEEFIHDATEPYYLNANDSFSSTSPSLIYNRFRIVPTETTDSRLRRYEPDDQLIHAADF